MPSTRIASGNQLFDTLLYVPAVTVPNLPASSTVSQTVTVPGINQYDFISWNQLSYVAGIAVDNIYASAVNTLVFTWTNNTVAAINSTPAQPFLFEVIRAENMNLGLTAIPTTFT